MGYPHVAFEAIHMILPENIPHQAVSLSKIEPVTIASNHPCGILTPML
jgi:hypothetical protein|tara:strand:- start:6286 stop:6429 length:144 start_codon:yes stop_codon:yes gene_type:complete